MRQFTGTAESVRERFAEVRGRVDAAAVAAGRAPASVAVLVATKYVAADHLGVLRDAGIRLIGENRAQDLAAKHELYGDAFEYHFIGHLQSRKTRLVLPLVTLIHSVDSLSVVQEIEARAAGPTEVLLQVNVGGEESKSGVAPAETERFLEAAGACPKVVFRGLMCMPPLFDDPRGRGRSSPRRASWRRGFPQSFIKRILSTNYRWGRAPTTRRQYAKAPPSCASAACSSDPTGRNYGPGRFVAQGGGLLRHRR